jgi:SAM-dependent methyltransferase
MAEVDLNDAARSWDALYRADHPPWEIDRSQAAVQRLLDDGAFHGEVLDVGCGTGENSMLLASRGLPVLGVDWAAAAVEMARAKAAERSLDVEFEVADALRLDGLGRSFDTILDSALFHTFSDEARAEYVPGLGSVTRPGSTLYLLCFSELERWGGGPRRVTQAEIRDAFGSGWVVRSIVPERYEIRFRPGYALAWLAMIERQGRDQMTPREGVAWGMDISGVASPR